MQEVGTALVDRGVMAIYLVHGVCGKAAAEGIRTELVPMFPAAAGAVRRVADRIAAELTEPTGHYSGHFAHWLESLVNRPGRVHLPVRLFSWSGENHHLGRADGAVRLIDELASLSLDKGHRVLLWGHDHGGNLLALVTNLLSGDIETIEPFFSATEVYFRWPIVGCIDVPVWNRVRQLLQSGPAPLGEMMLDLVTFGTPIRYGWARGGYSQLLHFVNHRPVRGLPEYMAPFPPDYRQVARAAGRDYFQQLGIAGTDEPPPVSSWRARLADQHLGQLLEPSEDKPVRRQRFQAGAIVPNDGTTLLVDYGESEEPSTEHRSGHVVYTSPERLLFHAEEAVRQFYTACASKAA